MRLLPPFAFATADITVVAFSPPRNAHPGRYQIPLCRIKAASLADALLALLRNINIYRGSYTGARGAHHCVFLSQARHQTLLPESARESLR